jgi:hypothetical protein
MLAFLRALVWLAVSAGVLLVGFAVVASALLAPSVIARGEFPGPVQREALGALYSALATKALLPELALTFSTWIFVAWLAPALDRARRIQAFGLFAVGALWFPALDRYLFSEIWSAGGLGNYLVTLFLVAGGAALALLIPRLVSPALAPGCFAAPPKRGMVEAR